MKHLEILQQEQAGPEAQEIFEGLKKKIGKVPNLYGTWAHSPVALKAILELEKALDSGFFGQKEIQAIELVISEVNQCHYCVDAHTVVAKMVGFSEDETLEIRAASIPNEKLSALTQLTREITLHRGRADDQYVERFFKAGYSKQALVELVAYVGFMTFNNYLNNLTEVPIDFPKAKSLQEAA